MLGEVDLPPVTGVRKPWVGTEPRQARTNAAATTCDQTDFSEAPVRKGATRTFLIPDAKLPAEFGLTETIGTVPQAKAAGFVDQVRAKLASCSDKQMGTEVERVYQVDTKNSDVTVWHVTTEISDERSVDYLMGVARDGTTVAQVGFVPAPDVAFEPGAFIEIVKRAQARLAAANAAQA
jgi:hypothetical protein